MKKILIILLACCALSACGDRVKKGDGSNWYFEPINTGTSSYGLIHSAFDCPAVKNGVIPNVSIRDDKFRHTSHKIARRDNFKHTFHDDKFRHTFCTKCMNDELIGKWYKWYEERERGREESVK